MGRFSIWAILFAAAAGMAMAQDQGKQTKGPAMPGLTLSTTAFVDGSDLPPKFTRASPNPVSPRLEWTHVPTGTASFVLIMHDPDAVDKRGTSDHLHWMVINIPATVHELPEGVPATARLADGAIQCKTMGPSGETIGYRGPGQGAVGPPHHYTFQLFALDAKLDLGPDATHAEVLKAMGGHVLGKGVLVGRSSKKTP